jgi:hypothetical protein
LVSRIDTAARDRPIMMVADSRRVDRVRAVVRGINGH